MTCRCSSPQEHTRRAMDFANEDARWATESAKKNADAEVQKARARLQELQERSPDPDRFAIDDIEQVGPHLVVKVEYPGCVRCSYDRRKVMVFLNTDIKQAIKWRRIDPHFREVTKSNLPAGQTEAPSPAARFPASRDGWCDALSYARGKES